MVHLPDIDIIESFKNNNRQVLNHIYDQYMPMIKHFVISHGGDDSEAWDVFQDAMQAIFLKTVSEDGLILTCTFRTYLYSICHHLWLKKIARKKRFVQLEDLEDTVIALDGCILKKIEEIERRKVLSTYFAKLERECKKLLELFYNGIPFKQIAPIMGYLSEEKAKKRKYMCKEELMKSVKLDPQFNEINF